MVGRQNRQRIIPRIFKDKIMKQLIIIIAVFCLSATTIVNNITITPAKPKNVVVKDFYMMGDANPFIKSKYQEGYILKSMVYVGQSYNQKIIIVMEKY